MLVVRMFYGRDFEPLFFRLKFFEKCLNQLRKADGVFLFCNKFAEILPSLFVWSFHAERQGANGIPLTKQFANSNLHKTVGSL